MSPRAGLVLCVSLLLGGGCGPSVPAAPQPLEGAVVAVRSEAGSIASFTVSTGDAEHEVLIDPAHDYGFDLTHLNEHRDTGDPVRVRWETRDGRPYAVSIDDA